MDLTLTSTRHQFIQNGDDWTIEIGIISKFAFDALFESCDLVGYYGPIPIQPSVPDLLLIDKRSQSRF